MPSVSAGKGPGWQGCTGMVREETLSTPLSAFRTEIQPLQPCCQQGAPLCFHQTRIIYSKLLQACYSYSISQVGAGTSDSMRGVSFAKCSGSLFFFIVWNAEMEAFRCASQVGVRQLLPCGEDKPYFLYVAPEFKSR